MKNPFPGMNPFLENYWHDVHTKLVTFISMDLNGELPEALVARAEEEVAIVGKLTPYRTDVTVVEDDWKSGLPPVWTPIKDSNEGREIVVTEPQIVITGGAEETRRWVEILDEAGKLITVIEVLSATNKRSGRGQADYLRKRRDYIDGGVNVVEIDLLRRGEATVDVPEDWIASANAAGRRIDYVICTRRYVNSGQREVYPVSLREKLPTVRIPLRKTDPDVALDLQSLIDRCFAVGRVRQASHQKVLFPPLSEEDQKWAGDLLKSAGLLA